MGKSDNRADAAVTPLEDSIEWLKETPSPQARRTEKDSSMEEMILRHIRSQHEEIPLTPESLSHIAGTQATTKALAELTRQGIIQKIHENVYVRTIRTRFGDCLPAFEDVIPHLAKMWNETIVPCGGTAANSLGLTTQVPVRPVYLTSGPSRRLEFGKLIVELRHAPSWELAGPGSKAGDALRALAWLGPAGAQAGLRILEKSITIHHVKELAKYHPETPKWISQAINARARTA